MADGVGFWLRWFASTNHEDSPVSTALPELPHSRQQHDTYLMNALRACETGSCQRGGEGIDLADSLAV